MITHNLAHALRYGDALVVLRDGKIIHRFTGDDKRGLSFEVLMRYCGFVS